MRIIFFALLICSPFTSLAQEFTIPDYQSGEDYSKQEENLLKVIEWLKTHPTDHPDRTTANAYVMAWATGSPTVSIGITEYVMSLNDGNPQYLLLFIGGWIEYALNNKDDYSEFEANYAAVNTIVAYYSKDIYAEKDKDLDKLVKLNKKGKLKDWVQKQL